MFHTEAPNNIMKSPRSIDSNFSQEKELLLSDQTCRKRNILSDDLDTIFDLNRSAIIEEEDTLNDDLDTILDLNKLQDEKIENIQSTNNETHAGLGDRSANIEEEEEDILNDGLDTILDLNVLQDEKIENLCLSNVTLSDLGVSIDNMKEKKISDDSLSISDLKSMNSFWNFKESTATINGQFSASITQEFEVGPKVSSIRFRNESNDKSKIKRIKEEPSSFLKTLSYIFSMLI